MEYKMQWKKLPMDTSASVILGKREWVKSTEILRWVGRARSGGLSPLPVRVKKRSISYTFRKCPIFLLNIAIPATPAGGWSGGWMGK